MIGFLCFLSFMLSLYMHLITEGWFAYWHGKSSSSPAQGPFRPACLHLPLSFSTSLLKFFWASSSKCLKQRLLKIHSSLIGSITVCLVARPCACSLVFEQQSKVWTCSMYFETDSKVLKLVLISILVCYRPVESFHNKGLANELQQL